jgi:hypothetical protein
VTAGPVATAVVLALGAAGRFGTAGYLQQRAAQAGVSNPASTRAA